jgi:hypothetical protein
MIASLAKRGAAWTASGAPYSQLVGVVVAARIFALNH